MRSDQKPHRRLDAKDAAGHVFAAMWTPVIVLLLGGFTIAAALSKFHIAKLMATFVLSKAGTRPRTVLVANMFVAMIASMWISNVAAPVLCFSIIQVRPSRLHSKLCKQSDSLASSPQPSVRLVLFQSPNSWHRACLQHRRRSVPNRLPSKHYRPAKHASPTGLGHLVLRRLARLYHLHSSNLALTPHHLPTRQRHHNYPHPPHEGQIHRRAVVYQRRHCLNNRAMVHNAPARKRLRRHGRRRHHPHRPLLRHRHPHQRRL